MIPYLVYLDTFIALSHLFVSPCTSNVVHPSVWVSGRSCVEVVRVCLLCVCCACVAFIYLWEVAHGRELGAVTSPQEGVSNSVTEI